MVSIGEVYAEAELRLDQAGFSGFQQALKNAEGDTKQFATNVSKTLLGIAASISTTVVGIGSYATYLAAGYQDISTTLGVLYGSTDMAAQKMQWLSSFAARTPFGLEELAQATVKMKAYGMEIEDLGTTIGDVAAGMGKSFDQVVEALADAQRGEFERLKELGIKVVEINKQNYAQMGVDIQEAGKLAVMYRDKNGQEQVEVVEKNNSKIMESTLKAIWNEKYAGAMDTLSKNFNGVLSNIQDNLQTGLAALAGFDFTTGTVRAESLLGVLSEIGLVVADLTEIFAGMSPQMANLIVLFGVWALGSAVLAAAIGLIGAASALATPGVIALATAVNSAIWPATLIVGVLVLLGIGLYKLEKQTSVFSKSFQLFKDIITIVYYKLSDVVHWFADGIKNVLVDIIPDSVINSIKNFIEWCDKLIDKAGKAIDKILETIHSAASREKTAREGDESRGTTAKETSGQYSNLATSGGLGLERNIKINVTADTSQSEPKIRSLKQVMTETKDEAQQTNQKLSEADGSSYGAVGEYVNQVTTNQQGAYTATENTNMALQNMDSSNIVQTATDTIGLSNAQMMATTGQQNLNTTVSQIDGSSVQALTIDYIAVLNGVEAVDASAKDMNLTITETGQLTLDGLSYQFVRINSDGTTANMTLSQMQDYLMGVNNTQLDGTVYQIGTVDQAGKIEIATNKEMATTLEKAGNIPMTGTVNGINAITSAWMAATSAAQAYAKAEITKRSAEIAQREADKESYSTGQTSSSGVKVLGKGQAVQSKSTTNITNIGTVNNNNPVASKTATLKISKA